MENIDNRLAPRFEPSMSGAALSRRARFYRHVAIAVLMLGLALVLACTKQATVQAGGATPPVGGGLPEERSEPAWRRWGGPGGDFKVTASNLAESWPREGPPLLWSRPLGGGYSAIVCDRGALFTIYRNGGDDGDDVVIALNAADGATLWEQRYPARIFPTSLLEWGSGPNATPLVLKDCLITSHYGGMLRALEPETGRLLWSLDLIEDLDGQVLECGNSASPVAYGDHVFILVGGLRQAVVALDPADGSVAWRSGSGTVSYGTPIVINVDGQEQLVYLSEDEAIGLDASNGTRLWSHATFNRNRDNISGPLWGEDHLMFVATQPKGGSSVIRLARNERGTEVSELWSDNEICIHFWNSLRLGDHVYASIGARGRTLACINIRSGVIEWQRRDFRIANLVHTGDTTILLDERGRLALVRLSPAGMTVLAKATISKEQTWTVPTLVGTTLFMRDTKTIRAFDLGAPEGQAGS